MSDRFVIPVRQERFTQTEKTPYNVKPFEEVRRIFCLGAKLSSLDGYTIELSDIEVKIKGPP